MSFIFQSHYSLNIDSLQFGLTAHVTDKSRSTWRAPRLFPQINIMAMATSGNQIKRPASSQDHNEPKRLKRHYHHHHCLQAPVLLPSTAEPAVQDEAHISHLLTRVVGQTLKDTGFDVAEPAALSSICSATEECMF
jgi:hypothetical protein